MAAKITKVSSSQAPEGEMGQRLLASGQAVAMRLWEGETDEGDKPPTSRPYETVGYAISGRAELHSGGEVVTLEPGDSWVVPEGAGHHLQDPRTVHRRRGDQPAGPQHLIAPPTPQPTPQAARARSSTDPGRRRARSAAARRTSSDPIGMGDQSARRSRARRTRPMISSASRALISP